MGGWVKKESDFSFKFGQKPSRQGNAKQVIIGIVRYYSPYRGPSETKMQQKVFMTMHFLKVSTIFLGLWDLVEDNSEEKPFVAILSRSIHIMPGLECPNQYLKNSQDIGFLKLICRPYPCYTPLIDVS